MTQNYPNDLRAAMWRTVHDCGKPVSSVAQALQCSDNYLYKAAASSIESAGPYDLFKVPALIAVTGRNDILHALAADQDLHLIAMPPQRFKKAEMTTAINICQSTNSRAVEKLIAFRDMPDDRNITAARTALRNAIRALLEMDARLRGDGQLPLGI